MDTFSELYEEMMTKKITERLYEEMPTKKMTFTIWDVGHGLSIWIKTPKGHNHWIDSGRNVDNDFSPPKHVNEQYNENKLDFLIITHPDSDHIGNLPDLIKYLGEPRVLRRNKTLPNVLKYGDEKSEYQKCYKNLDLRYTSNVDWSESPCNPEYNGGIKIKTDELKYEEGMNKNDTSVIALYFYAEHLFFCPGDISPNGWSNIWNQCSKKFSPIINKAKYKILIAPHHGRETGYSEEMMNIIEPHLVIICDKWGGGDTHKGFREKPKGLDLNGVIKRYKSTKNTGRIKFTIGEDGTRTYSEV